MNISVGTGGMHVRSAVRCMRSAFASGRNATTRPLFWRKTLRPSKHSWP